jgi:hypothetical protein
MPRRPFPVPAAEIERPFQPFHQCGVHSTFLIGRYPYLTPFWSRNAPAAVWLCPQTGGLAVPAGTAPDLNDYDTAAHSHVRCLAERGGGECRVASRRQSTLLTFGTVPDPGQQTGTTGRSTIAIRLMVLDVFAFQPCSSLQAVGSTWHPSRLSASDTVIHGLSYWDLRSMSSRVCIDTFAAQ